MRTSKIFRAILILVCFFQVFSVFGQYNEYVQRFLDLRDKIYDDANGYFSDDGVPYHSVESLICEAPDQGHETTSEAYSYWIWLNVMYGGITGDWDLLNSAWSVMETKAIPTSELQPTVGDYNPQSPATFAGEHALPDYYPSPLENDVPVGVDPVSSDLTAAYGSEIYGMHWLFDCDNFYGYGNKGDGTSTPSYINTFQRGEQESVWETVTHPSWENFTWGNTSAGTGFLQLFTSETNAPSSQWRYTNAPDADARIVQAMYWASEFAKDQGLDPESALPLDKASKMGDFLRLSMFDKYFKPLGVQDKYASGGTGYESAHYLLAWYYAWGGPLTSQGWSWRIGCSHSHFGYQNPVAAYALSQYQELIPVSQNGARDWGVSLDRQLEFYTWLQSAEGAIAGGATNSFNGVYDRYPSGTATFYGMAYDDNPVYHDPGSNTWFGMQAWSMERVAEYYYITNDTRAKSLLDNWVAWILDPAVVILNDDGTFDLPSTLEWSGQPNTWNPDNPTANTGLHVNIVDHSKDLGITACLAKALIYYAAATQRYETLDTDTRDLAKELLDRMWTKYYEENGAGVAVEEEREDFSRFFDTIYIPEGWSGVMANGDVIEPGVRFIDIRSNYRNDPDFAALEYAYNHGEVYTKKYHRFWAQVDIALANAEYGRFFGGTVDVDPTGVTVSPAELTMEVGDRTKLSAEVEPNYATNKNVTWSSSNTGVVTVNNEGTVTASGLGKAFIIVTTEVGGLSDTCTVTVAEDLYELSVTIEGTGSGTVTLSPEGGAYEAGTEVTLTATPGSESQFDGWTGDIESTSSTVSIIMNSDKRVTATFSKDSPCGSYTGISIPFSFDGAGEYCWETSDDIAYINSWNMTTVEINGVDFTNTWSSNLPSKIDGHYYIYYNGSYNWSHFEAGGSKSLSTNKLDAGKTGVKLFPNPFSGSTTLMINNPESVSEIVVLDQVGRIVLTYGEGQVSSTMTIGEELDFGLYYVKVVTDASEKVLLINKQ